jgi:hypothetical protein
LYEESLIKYTEEDENGCTALGHAGLDEVAGKRRQHLAAAPRSLLQRRRQQQAGRQPEPPAALGLALGIARIITLHHHPSTVYQIR